MSGEVHAEVDREARAARITTTFDQPPAVVWTLWSDPTRLARWWGPPGMPMDVDHHDLRPGGRVEVVVHARHSTIRGHWAITTVDEPRSLRFTFTSDGLAPTEIDVRLDETSDGATAMTLTAWFASDADLARALEIGFVEGLTRSCRSAAAAL